MSSPMHEMPKHLPITVDENGHGPLDDSDPAGHVECWCKPGMPWPHPGSDSGEPEDPHPVDAPPSKEF